MLPSFFLLIFFPFLGQYLSKRKHEEHYLSSPMKVLSVKFRFVQNFGVSVFQFLKKYVAYPLCHIMKFQQYKWNQFHTKRQNPKEFYSTIALMWPTLGTVTFGIIGFIRPLWSTSMHFPQITKLTFKIRQKLFIYSVNCISAKEGELQQNSHYKFR